MRDNLLFSTRSKYKSKALKRYLIFILIGSLSGLFLRFLLQAELEQATWPWLDWSFWLLLGMAQGGTALLISGGLDRYLGWKEQPGRRWLIGWLVNTLVVMLVCYLAYLAYNNWVLPQPLTEEQAFAFLLKGGLILAFLVLAYSVVYFAIRSYQHYGRLRLNTLKEERQRLDLQWQSLRSQLQPHFLFNSLNTISALVDADAERAETFIRKLAHTYRYSLKTYEQPLILLRQEMRLVESYFYLLQTRYPDSLRLEVDLLAGAETKQVPPLAVQLLVENAVKHSSFSTEKPLVIRISANEENLWVQNPWRPRTEVKSDSFAVGLDNLEARYELLEGGQIDVQQTDLFTVKIPLLP